MIDRPVVDLPQPDSPTSPTHSPSATLNETPVDRLHVRGTEMELGLEVLDLEDDVAVRAALRCIHDSGSLERSRA